MEKIGAWSEIHLATKGEGGMVAMPKHNLQVVNWDVATRAMLLVWISPFACRLWFVPQVYLSRIFKKVDYPYIFFKHFWGHDL